MSCITKVVSGQKRLKSSRFHWNNSHLPTLFWKGSQEYAVPFRQSTFSTKKPVDRAHPCSESVRRGPISGCGLLHSRQGQQICRHYRCLGIILERFKHLCRCINSAQRYASTRKFRIQCRLRICARPCKHNNCGTCPFPQVPGLWQNRHQTIPCL